MRGLDLLSIFSFLIVLQIAWVASNDLPTECMSFATDVDKSACKKHYFTFIFVLLGEPSKKEAERHLNITKWLLKPCYDLESKPPRMGSKEHSFVTFADHDWKINLPKYYTFDEILDLPHTEQKYDYIYITKDISSVKDLAAMIDIALGQMRESNLEDHQFSVLLLLNALDKQVYYEFGDSLLPFIKESVKKFTDHKAISKLVFTIDQEIDPYIQGLLRDISNASTGYFDYVVDPMTDEAQVAKNYGMCSNIKN